MRNLKPSLILAASGVIGVALLARGFVDMTGNHMAESASRFLSALDDSQKAQATFAFTDAERLNWHFIPKPRKGLPVKAMTPAAGHSRSACSTPAWERRATPRPPRS